MFGYLSAEYAHSLTEFGTPRALPRAQGWLLERAIGETGHRDAMGCYPLFCCGNWLGLADDLPELAPDIVSLGVVPDPFMPCTAEDLQVCFDRVVPFKQHFVVDLEQDPAEYVSRHHRYYARKALREATVVACAQPLEHLEEWIALYEVLVQRHQLRGLKAFSRASFIGQLQAPGLVLLRMSAGTELLAMQLWYRQGPVAFSHLTAYSAAAYHRRASYGLYWAALEMWRRGELGAVRILNLGAGAGIGTDGATATDGLTEFKRGWSTGAKPAYFCGRILNSELYEELSRRKCSTATNYFPAYRAGEFA